MIHLERVLHILAEVAADPDLHDLIARREPRAVSLKLGTEQLLTDLRAKPPALGLSATLAALHELRGHCDWQPLDQFASLFDEAIREVTQTAILAP